MAPMEYVLHIAEPVGESPPSISTGPAHHIRGRHSPTLIGTDVQDRESGLRRITLPRTPVNRGCKAHRMSLSLLASILSSTSSKNPGSMRAPPSKGCPKAPMVNKTSPITAARVTTISLCAHVLCRPNRYVKPTAAIPPKIKTDHRIPGTPSSEAIRRVL